MPDVQPLTTQLATLLPGNTPTALSAAVTTILGATPQSALPIQIPQLLAVGRPPVPPPVHSKTPLYLGIGAGVIGVGLVAWMLMRKKRRK